MKGDFNCKFFTGVAIAFISVVSVIVWPIEKEENEKEGEGKMAPWQASVYKWSYPDAVWNPADADGALETVKRHFEDEFTGRAIGGEWRMEGPGNIGGRMNVIKIDPNDSNRIFAGNACGGLFISEDAGNSWNPVTDDFAWMAIGSIDFHPVDAGTVYVGMGDPQISSHPRIGDGVWKTTDNGTTWEHLGLDSARIVSDLIVLDDAPNVIMAATMGNPAVPGPERGLYRSDNGGETWSQVLLPSDSAGVNDIAYDPESNVMIAAGWNRLRNSVESIVTGPESKLYRSTDQGVTWYPIDNPWGNEDRCRIGLSESNGRFYALVVGLDMQVDNIYKSDDGGITWNAIVPENNNSLLNALGGFGWYFSKIRVNPWDSNDISILGVDLWNTTDGGQTWTLLTPPWYEYTVHADKHDMQWVGPNSCIIATDGGAYRTDDHGTTWTDIENIPNTQFYRVEINPHQPGIYTGGAQDNGTTSGSYQEINMWSRDRGGDGFTPIFHPQDSNYRIATVQFANFAYTVEPGDEWGYWWEEIEDTDYYDRKGWDAPIMLHPANPDHLWTGTQRMWKMEGGPWNQWQAMSEDLTHNVEPGLSYRVVSAIAGAPYDENVVAAGTADGRVWVTQNGGESWQEMVQGLPNRYITDLYFDPYNEGTLMCTVSGYKDYVYTPHVFKAQLGGYWQSVSGDLPHHPMNSIVALADDVWALASDAGVFATVNGGVNWDRLGQMPWIPVFDLAVDTTMNRLVAGTFARSVQSFPTDSILAASVPPLDTCPEDIVINGQIDIFDMLELLSQYGCNTNCNSADINDDSLVNTDDLLMVLALFGQAC